MSDPVADALRRQAEAARGLIASLQDDDPDLVHDMAEGSTGIMEAIDMAIAEMDECDTITEGCKAQVAVYEARASKFAARKQRVRALIEQAMLIADLPKAKRPTATITVKRTPPKPIIADESLIPSRFYKQPPPVLDKTAINEAVNGGEVIPGVAMDNGGISLQVRRT